MGLWPPVEAEFGMGEREVYFGSARTRSSPEGAPPEGWGAETFSRLCLQGARAEPPPAGRHGVGVAGRPPKSLSSLSLGQISLSQVQSPNGLMCRNPAPPPTDLSKNDLTLSQPGSISSSRHSRSRFWRLSSYSSQCTNIQVHLPPFSSFPYPLPPCLAPKPLRRSLLPQPLSHNSTNAPCPPSSSWVVSLSPALGLLYLCASFKYC